MIENIPTADELRTISLRLYFKAWAEITQIVTEWFRYGAVYASDVVPLDGELPTLAGGPSPGEMPQEWHDYIASAQSDLQGIYTLIQQSQEIGLKARICEVSPYLLLKRTDIKPTDASTNTWDFTDFPTIDAAELIRVHNTFCSTVLSKEFQAKYDEMRRNRNKISHLGVYKGRIDPKLIIDMLQLQFRELYPRRRWMEDRLDFAALHRWADYNDSDFNERTALFDEMWQLLPWLSDNQFRCLMSHDRDEDRYICHSCAADALVGGNEPYAGDVPTAYRVGEELQVSCVICDKTYSIKQGKCARDDCECELLSAETDSDGACMVCGWTVEEWQAEQERRLKQAALGWSGFPKTVV